MHGNAACARCQDPIPQVLVVAQEGDPSGNIRLLAADRSVDAFVLSELQRDDPRVNLLCQLGMPFVCFGRTGPAHPPGLG